VNRPQRNNNPGNLKFAKQKHAVDVDGFAAFQFAHQGWQALVRQIKLDQMRGDSLEKFVSEYAPDNENDTVRYIAHVCKSLHAQVNEPLSNYSVYVIAGLLAQWEGYFVEE
jgi:hypothetical protein